MTIPTLRTVKQFAIENPAFTPGGLRFQIFNEDENGLKEAGAIIRIGRKVLIDVDRYFEWVYSQNQCFDSAIKKEAAVNKRRRKRSPQSRAVVSA